MRWMNLLRELAKVKSLDVGGHFGWFGLVYLVLVQVSSQHSVGIFSRQQDCAKITGVYNDWVTFNYGASDINVCH
jgi:hypothetical protein